MEQQKRHTYEGLNGLRAYASLGILLVHVIERGQYKLRYNTLMERGQWALPSLVFLFMMISSFSICCGYQEGIANGSITPGEFYKKRYQRIWPFFAVVCLLDFVMSPSLPTLYELLADLTLCFGLLPVQRISVAGVGWFVGLLFVFYFLFPFVSHLLSDKRRAWIAFGITILFSQLTRIYFFTDAYMDMHIKSRSNIVYSMPYFFTGCMIYLYREPIARFAKKFWYLFIPTCISLSLWFLYRDFPLVACYFLYTLLLVLALGVEHKGLLNNPVIKFLGSISMEIYLCHSGCLRIVQYLNLTHLFASPVLSIFFASTLVLILSIFMSLGVKYGLILMGKWIGKCKEKWIAKRQEV